LILSRIFSNAKELAMSITVSVRPAKDSISDGLALNIPALHVAPSKVLLMTKDAIITIEGDHLIIDAFYGQLRVEEKQDNGKRCIKPRRA
jgi:hypothetical protein